MGATVAGLLLFLFPGIAWTRVLAPALSWTSSVLVGVIAAFTIAPLMLFALHVLFSVPLAIGPMAFLCLALGLSAVALRAGPWVAARLPA